MAEERIKTMPQDGTDKRDRESARSQDELSPEQLESVAGGAAFQEGSEKKKTSG